MNTVDELKKQLRAITEEMLSMMAPSIRENVDQRLEQAIDAFFLNLIGKLEVRKGER